MARPKHRLMILLLHASCGSWKREFASFAWCTILSRELAGLRASRGHGGHGVGFLLWVLAGFSLNGSKNDFDWFKFGFVASSENSHTWLACWLKGARFWLAASLKVPLWLRGVVLPLRAIDVLPVLAALCALAISSFRFPQMLLLFIMFCIVLPVNQ